MNSQDLLLKLKVLYEKIANENFEEYINHISESLIAGIDIDYLIKKNIKPTKRRWKKNIIENRTSEFNKELDYLTIQFNKVEQGEVDITEIKDRLGIEKIEEFKTRTLNKIDDWINDEEKYLSEFIYINSLSKKSKMYAVKYDLITMKLRNKDIEIPPILTDMPIDVTNKLPYFSSDEEEKINKTNVEQFESFDKLISLGEDEKEKLLLELKRNKYLQIKNGTSKIDIMTQIALLKSIKYLNSFDVKVMLYYYNNYKNILQGEPIDNSEYEVLTNMGLSTNKANYDNLEDSLAKLGSLTISYRDDTDVESKGEKIYENDELEIVINENEKLYGSIFSDTIIYRDSKNTRRVKVYLGSLLTDMTASSIVLKYDEKTFNSLSNSAQQIAIWLQKRRYKLLLKGINEEYIPLSAYSNAIYFGTRRKDRIRATVKKSLEELKRNNLILEDYGYENPLDLSRVRYMNFSVPEKNRLDINNECENLIESNIIKKIK